MKSRPAPALLLVLFGLLPGAAHAEPPAARKQPRTDLLGDPLPEPVVARLGTERLCMPGFPGAEFLAFSADGKLLAGASWSELRLWEVSTGKERWRALFPRVRGDSPRLGPVAFSPDGKLLVAAVTGDDRAAIHVWDVASGREARKLDCGGRVWYLAFSPDGKALAASGPRGLILWDPAAGQRLGAWGPLDGAGELAFLPDGKTLTVIVYGKDGRAVSVRDAASGEERRRRPLEPETDWRGALSPDGALAAVPTRDGRTIRLIATRSNEEVCRTEGAADGPRQVAFAADGRTLTATSRDGTVRVWSAATGKLVRRFTGLAPPIQRAALSPDGSVLATADRADVAVHLWDVAKGQELHTFPGHRAGPLVVAFTGDGKAVLTASLEWMHSFSPREWAPWSLRRWDPETGKELRVTARDPKGQVHAGVFSADARRLATLLNDGTLRLWDVDAGRELRDWKLPTNETRSISGGDVTIYPYPAVTDLALPGDGKVLFGSHAGRVRRWETATGKELPPLTVPGWGGREGPRGAHVAPSPDGRLVAVTGRQSRGRQTVTVTVVLDTSTGQKLHELTTEGGSLGSGAFSPDGRTLAVSAEGGVALWEVASGRSRGRLARGGRFRFTVTFSPDGRLLAVGGDGPAEVQLWDLMSDRPAGGLDWPGAQVSSLAFSPDGRRLAVAGSPNVAVVCDVPALLKGGPAAPLKVSADDRERLWAELADADGGRAFRAAHRLAASGPEGVALLESRLRAPAAVDAKRLARLIGELDAEAFEAREKATEELEGLGEQAEAALREALKAGPSAEARTRLELLLRRLKYEGDGRPPPALVALRAVEALELNGGPEARAVLERLAKGRPGERLTAEARASLARLAQRPAKP
jgi:WD40 repeat protein